MTVFKFLGQLSSLEESVIDSINGLVELRENSMLRKYCKTIILLSTGPMDPKKLKPGLTRSIKDVICFCSDKSRHTDFSEDKEVKSII